MSLRITETEITSTETHETARFTPDASADGQGAWIISWLWGRLLTRDQAVTAMTLAEAFATGKAYLDSPQWPHFCNWADELGLSGLAAFEKLANSQRARWGA